MQRGECFRKRKLPIDSVREIVWSSPLNPSDLPNFEWSSVLQVTNLQGLYNSTIYRQFLNSSAFDHIGQGKSRSYAGLTLRKNEDVYVLEKETLKKKSTKSPSLTLPQYADLDVLWDSLVDSIVDKQTIYAFKKKCKLSGSIFESLSQSSLLPPPNREKLLGINTEYIYFGSLGSCSALHIEDYILDSINVMLRGSPKLVLFISKECARKLSRLIADKAGINCLNVLNHKAIIVTTAFLREHSVDYCLKMLVLTSF